MCANSGKGSLIGQIDDSGFANSLIGIGHRDLHKGAFIHQRTHCFAPDEDVGVPMPRTDRSSKLIDNPIAQTYRMIESARHWATRRPPTRGSAGLGPPPRTSPRRPHPLAPCRAGCPGDWNRN
jgi:hypothetical protein